MLSPARSSRLRGKSSPWAWVAINQLAFPGLGTILAGRKVGYVQAVVMVAGFMLSVGFMLWFILCTMRRMVHSEWSAQEFRSQYQPYLWALQWGLGLVAIAWLWSLWSSIWILKRTKTNPPPLLHPLL